MSAVERLTRAIGEQDVIGREIGHRGMATVFLARDRKHDRDVTTEVLRPERSPRNFADRFPSEITVPPGLQHSHILPLFESGAVDELPDAVRDGLDAA
jgi:serine/threonine-protein kinase